MMSIFISIFHEYHHDRSELQNNHDRSELQNNHDRSELYNNHYGNTERTHENSPGKILIKAYFQKVYFNG